MLKPYIKIAIRNLRRNSIIGLIAVVTISIQAIKAAIVNPVINLRTE